MPWRRSSSLSVGCNRTGRLYVDVDEAGRGDADAFRGRWSVLTATIGAAEAVDSLAELFEAEYERMVRLAFLLVGSNEVAEELVQDAFVRLQRRWESVQSPGGYLRTTVVNACRDHHRRRAVREAFRPDPRPPVTIPEPDDIAERLLKVLTPRRRAAVVLRYWEGLPDEEIAELLDCRPATVRSLVHRALNQLREVLDT